MEHLHRMRIAVAPVVAAPYPHKGEASAMTDDESRHADEAMSELQHERNMLRDALAALCSAVDEYAPEDNAALNSAWMAARIVLDEHGR